MMAARRAMKACGASTTAFVASDHGRLAFGFADEKPKAFPARSRFAVEWSILRCRWSFGHLGITGLTSSRWRPCGVHSSRRTQALVEAMRAT